MADRTAWHTEDWTTATGGFTSQHVADVSAWPTFEFRAQQVGGSNREFAQVRLQWYHQDPVANPGTEPGGVFDWEWSIPDQVAFTGPHRGKFVEVLLSAPTAGRTIRWSIADTTAPEENVRAMQTTGLVLNGLWINLGAGTQGPTVYALPTTGPLTLALGVETQPGTFRINVGGAPYANIPVGVAEKVKHITIDAPRAQVNGYVVNNSTFSANFSLRAITGNA